MQGPRACFERLQQQHFWTNIYPGSFNDVESRVQAPEDKENTPQPGNTQRDSQPNDLTITRQTTQKWTVVHCYYAQMGGLVVYLDRCSSPTGKEATEYILTSARFVHVKQNPKRWEDKLAIEPPLTCLVLDKNDIQDKSKADWLVKGLAVLQILWIILNSAARKITGLAITQIEIATVAFAVMAVLIYLTNWWKPKDVSRPTMLPRFGADLVRAPIYKMQSFMLWLWSPVQATRKKSDHWPRRIRVPNDFIWLQEDAPWVFSLMAGSSLLFGGMHCLAWNFEFPTPIELTCWRAVRPSL